MRIAVASWSARSAGGVEEYLSILLPALRRAGHDLAFWHEVDLPWDHARINVPPGTLDICEADLGRNEAIRQLREWRPDLVYSQGLRDLTADETLLAIAPAIFFLHTYTGTCVSGTKTFSRPVPVPCSRRFGWPCLVHYFPRGCGGNDPVTMWRLFKSQSARLALYPRYGAILTHTAHMRNEMARHGLPAAVVPYPVEPGAGTGTPAREGVWRLLFAGRMESLKGGHYLIEALPEIVGASQRPVRAILVGDGSERARWERRAREIEAATPNLTVEFTGWLTHEQVDGLMKKVDLLVVPSLWPEPFGTVGPSAGQVDLPAAAFNSGGISQWLEDGVSGHLAPADPPTPAGLARAVMQCLEDPVHYAALRAGARQMAARFTMDRHLEALMEHFERVCA